MERESIVIRSGPFNRYYHAMLRDFHKQALKEKLTVENMDFLKQGLKKLDENYPKIDGKPVSTSKIDNKTLTQHIEFMIAFMAEYGFVSAIVEEEWKRLMEIVR